MEKQSFYRDKIMKSDVNRSIEKAINLLVENDVDLSKALDKNG